MAKPECSYRLCRGSEKVLNRQRHLRKRCSYESIERFSAYRGKSCDSGCIRDDPAVKLVY